jgi:hypothetical protein
VVADRLIDILTLMQRFEREGTGGVTLCAVAAEFLELDGAGVVVGSKGGNLSVLCTSNQTAHDLMDLELVLGEGPALEANEHGAVEEPDLLHPKSPRWMMYTPRAITLGARAVFGFSIQLGAVQFGALSLFRASAGPLTAHQVSDGYLMASVIGRSVLAHEAGVASGDLRGEVEEVSGLDVRVHQAAGMLAIQGSMSVRDALVTLRAHAFATSSHLNDVANDVVARRKYYEPSTGMWRNNPDVVTSAK